MGCDVLKYASPITAWPPRRKKKFLRPNTEIESSVESMEEKKSAPDTEIGSLAARRKRVSLPRGTQGENHFLREILFEFWLGDLKS